MAPLMISTIYIEELYVVKLHTKFQDDPTGNEIVSAIIPRLCKTRGIFYNSKNALFAFFLISNFSSVDFSHKKTFMFDTSGSSKLYTMFKSPNT